MKKIIILCACVVLASMYACNQEGSGSDDKPSGNDSIQTDENGKPVVKEKLVEIDTLLTNTARFIAGMELIGADTGFSAYAKEDYYQSHLEYAKTSWETTESTMLKPIHDWLSGKGMIDERTDATCFYPLSGPDFLFGNAFYPNAQYYVMMGLEPRGTWPDFSKMDYNTRKDYFNVLRGSMKYLNSRGYFVTEHMGGDFSRRHFNGMLHMMLYMMAKTNHYICDFYVIAIQPDGTERRLETGEETPEKTVAVNVIEFTGADRKVLRKAYYLKQDVSDEKLTEVPGFEKYMSAFPNRMTYMKSASCVLFNPQFNTMRQLVLSCDKILQDDTGIPYHYIVESGSFDIQLFGTYSKVIKQIPWCKQQDLEKALTEIGENKELPFKISYNGHHNEGIVVYAVKKKSN
jgi:hypothetical protein